MRMRCTFVGTDLKLDFDDFKNKYFPNFNKILPTTFKDLFQV